MSPEIELFPYFQPIVCIASGKIVGYEALARQRGPNKQIISAGHLLGSPELDTRQRTELDRQIRWQALQKFAKLNDGSYLTLNISATWIDNLRQISASPTLKMLEQLHIDRSRIVVEITEAHADLHKLTQIAKRYRKHGLRVALDDFGAGSSQLERVMAIHPDILKIDMRLFKQACKGGIAGEVVNLMSQLGKRTGCQIVCEGVESDEEFMFGLNCGAQYMQGFLFAPAEAEFKVVDTYQKHITSLRNKFVKQSIGKLQSKIVDFNAIKRLIYRLAEALQGDFNLNELVNWNFSQSGVMRFYLCDNLGYQTSPDFNFNDNKWYTDPRKIGFNWSWRPYFYQLLALEAASDGKRIVTSESYRDFNSEQLCKTLSLRLDDYRILLVDIVAED